MFVTFILQFILVYILFHVGFEIILQEKNTKNMKLTL